MMRRAAALSIDPCRIERIHGTTIWTRVWTDTTNSAARVFELPPLVRRSLQPEPLHARSLSVHLRTTILPTVSWRNPAALLLLSVLIGSPVATSLCAVTCHSLVSTMASLGCHEDQQPDATLDSNGGTRFEAVAWDGCGLPPAVVSENASAVSTRANSSVPQGLTGLVFVAVTPSHNSVLTFAVPHSPLFSAPPTARPLILRI